MKLFPYQVEGARYLASNKRAGLFDEMGTGKTIQAIKACHLVKAKRVLIVAPAYLLPNWQAEWRKLPLPTCKIRYLSYHFVRTATKIKEPFDVVIVDESHALKDPKAKQSKNFLKVFYPNAKRLWLLTGTPATKTAADYFLQLSMLMPGKLGKYRDFYEEYAYVREVGIGLYKRKDIYGFRNTDRLNRLIKRCSIRRTLKDVLPQLPRKFFQDLYLDLPFPEVESSDVEASIREGKMYESLIPPMRQLGLDKVREAEEYLLQLPPPYIIFTWFRETAEAVASILSKDWKVDLITGADSPSKRLAKVDKFQAEESDILVCTMSSAGAGLTITRASLVVFLELPFSPAIYDQACGRAVRIGQTKKVRIVNIIAEDSPDDRILEILQDKREGMEECLR